MKIPSCSLWQIPVPLTPRNAKGDSPRICSLGRRRLLHRRDWIFSASRMTWIPALWDMKWIWIWGTGMMIISGWPPTLVLICILMPLSTKYHHPASAMMIKAAATPSVHTSGRWRRRYDAQTVGQCVLITTKSQHHCPLSTFRILCISSNQARSQNQDPRSALGLSIRIKTDVRRSIVSMYAVQAPL